MNVLTSAILWILSTSPIYCCQSRSGSKYNPVLEFNPVKSSGTTLLWYQAENPKTYQSYKKDFDDFLEPYLRDGRSENAELCEKNQLPSKGKFCDFKAELDKRNYWGRCTSEFRYGLHSREGGPCIFLTLKVPSGWMPEYYTYANAPAEMPPHLKKTIMYEEMTRRHPMVWVNCEGELPFDMENIGEISYNPSRGFRGNYFAHNDLEGYLSPIVAVYFENPIRGVLINIECTAWAKNIRRDREAMLGKVHVELLIDDIHNSSFINQKFDNL